MQVCACHANAASEPAKIGSCGLLDASVQAHQSQQHRRIGRRKHVVRAEGKEGSPILKGSVAAVTSVLNALNVRKDVKAVKVSSPPASIAEVADRLRADYVTNQYFVTGDVDLGLYEVDCLFADPTISFRGREKYTSNLQTLKAFFIDPTIHLYSLKKTDMEPLSMKARWRLKVQLRLPWRPMIDIEGSTLYSLNQSTNQIFEHREQWSVSAWEAVLQIFKINRLSDKVASNL